MVPNFTIHKNGVVKNANGLFIAFFDRESNEVTVSPDVTLSRQAEEAHASNDEEAADFISQSIGL